MKFIKDFKAEDINNVVALAVFGSYETQYFRKNISDIDILVVMNQRDDVAEEFDLEDILAPQLSEFFSYEDIHLTFISFKDYDSVFAKLYVESKNKLIIDEFKEVDFRLSVNKYLRDYDWLFEKERQDTMMMEGAK